MVSNCFLNIWWSLATTSSSKLLSTTILPVSGLSHELMQDSNNFILSFSVIKFKAWKHKTTSTFLFMTLFSEKHFWKSWMSISWISTWRSTWIDKVLSVVQAPVAWLPLRNVCVYSTVIFCSKWILFVSTVNYPRDMCEDPFDSGLLEFWGLINFRWLNNRLCLPARLTA